MTPNLEKNRALRNILKGCGLTEIYSYSFTNLPELSKIWPDNPPAAVSIKNPLTDDHTHLRPTLVTDMLKCISRNKANSPTVALHLFELGKIFHSPEKPAETESLAISVCGRGLSTPTRSDYRFETQVYYELKGIVESFIDGTAQGMMELKPASNALFHPYRCAEISIGGRKIGEMGEVHPGVCRAFDIREPSAVAVFDLDAIKEMMGREPLYSNISRRPALVRDLSVIVDENVSAQAIGDVIRSHGTNLLELAAVIDVFRGEKIGAGLKSVTFALEFRSADRTLTDEEINPVMEKIIFYLRDEVGGVLRDS
jgi:phenylalanyl-tRNA synthetase beta chain